MKKKLLNLNNAAFERDLPKLITYCSSFFNRFMLGIDYKGNVEIMTCSDKSAFDEMKAKGKLYKFILKIRTGDFARNLYLGTTHEIISLEGVADAITRFWGTGAEGYIGEFNTPIQGDL
jgi:hypothetical protein